MKTTCRSCGEELAAEFRFCPHCGYDLQKPTVCPSCQHPNKINSRFCQHCGVALSVGLVTLAQGKSREAGNGPARNRMEPPPDKGITIQFSYSSSVTFDFAVDCAKQFSTFRQFGDNKKAVYRVTFDPPDMGSALELVEHLKGWRTRIVYVDGEKVTWESVFSFTWCYQRMKASFKPQLYCFGYEHEYEFNVWGCIQAYLPFRDDGQWFCWGTWLNKQGDWKFDKKRIGHELQKALYRYRFCPALQPGLIEDVLKALPDVVNPNKDRNWKFVERWDDDTRAGLVVTRNLYGVEERVVMIGVSPSGQGALKDMAKRMRYRLPAGR